MNNVAAAEVVDADESASVPGVRVPVDLSDADPELVRYLGATKMALFDKIPEIVAASGLDPLVVAVVTPFPAALQRGATPKYTSRLDVFPSLGGEDPAVFTVRYRRGHIFYHPQLLSGVRDPLREAAAATRTGCTELKAQLEYYNSAHQWLRNFSPAKWWTSDYGQWVRDQATKYTGGSDWDINERALWGLHLIRHLLAMPTVMTQGGVHTAFRTYGVSQSTRRTRRRKSKTPATTATATPKTTATPKLKPKPTAKPTTPTMTEHAPTPPVPTSNGGAPNVVPGALRQAVLGTITQVLVRPGVTGDELREAAAYIQAIASFDTP